MRFFVSENNNADFSERVYKLTFDPIRTIKANNAKLTLEQANGAIRTEFLDKGYIEDDN